MANTNADGTRMETALGVIQNVPNGYLVLHKDGTSLLPADLNRKEFVKYLGQIFQKSPKVGDSTFSAQDKFVGYCANQIFATPANNTVLKAMQAIVTYLGTAANIPIAAGASVENPVDAKNRVMWHVLNAVRNARGLEVPEESPNFS